MTSLVHSQPSGATQPRVLIIGNGSVAQVIASHLPNCDVTLLARDQTARKIDGSEFRLQSLKPSGCERELPAPRTFTAKAIGWSDLEGQDLSDRWDMVILTLPFPVVQSLKEKIEDLVERTGDATFVQTAGEPDQVLTIEKTERVAYALMQFLARPSETEQDTIEFFPLGKSLMEFQGDSRRLSPLIKELSKAGYSPKIKDNLLSESAFGNTCMLVPFVKLLEQSDWSIDTLRQQNSGRLVACIGEAVTIMEQKLEQPAPPLLRFITRNPGAVKFWFPAILAAAKVWLYFNGPKDIWGDLKAHFTKAEVHKQVSDLLNMVLKEGQERGLECGELAQLAQQEAAID